MRARTAPEKLCCCRHGSMNAKQLKISLRLHRALPRAFGKRQLRLWTWFPTTGAAFRALWKPSWLSSTLPSRWNHLPRVTLMCGKRSWRAWWQPWCLWTLWAWGFLHSMGQTRPSTPQSRNCWRASTQRLMKSAWMRTLTQLMTNCPSDAKLRRGLGFFQSPFAVA